MKHWTLLLACSTLLLSVGCGNEQESDEEQIRDALVAYTQDLMSGDFAEACRRTANPADCITGLRSAELAVGGREELIVSWDADPEEMVEGARNAKVVMRGDQATVDNPATPEPGVQAVRRDGRWKFVFPTD